MAASDDRAQWAFLKLLKSSESGKEQSSMAKDSEKETDNLNLPSCLSQILGIRQPNNEVKIPCLICEITPGRSSKPSGDLNIKLLIIQYANGPCVQNTHTCPKMTHQLF